MGAGRGYSALRGGGEGRRGHGTAKFVTLDRADCARMTKLRSQRKEQLQVKLYLDCRTHF